jgi:hypothetical protein
VKKLYIIGNGFDLHHSIKTSYSHFHLYIKSNYPNLIEFLDNYFDLQVDSLGLWNQFEKDLGTFNSSLFWEDHCQIDLQDDDLQYSNFYGLEDELKEVSKDFLELLRSAFVEWITNTEIISKPKIKLDKTANFLTFNYTRLLEDYYNISDQQILHLHGHIESDELIIGHNIDLEVETELDKYGDSNRTMLSDSEAISKSIIYNFRKPVEKLIKAHQEFFNSVESFEIIYVFGHSLNEIDQPYFAEIIKKQKAKKWKVSYHNETEKESFKIILTKLGLDENKLEMIRL